jgi:hypothetical protein
MKKLLRFQKAVIKLLPLEGHTLRDNSQRFSENSYFDFLLIYTYTWIAKYLSVAYNAKDGVLIYVSASTGRQECGIEA